MRPLRHPVQQLIELGPHGALEGVRRRAHKLFAAEFTAQTNDQRRMRQLLGFFASGFVNLAPNSVSRDGTARPTLGQEYTQPSIGHREKRPTCVGAFVRGVQRHTVQGEVGGFGHEGTRHNGLKLLL
jgi:hypothetical protein